MHELEINRGSDLTFTMTWREPSPDPNNPLAGDPLDLTGYTFTVYEPHPAIAGHLTITPVDLSVGALSGRLEWQEDMPTGRIMNFRIRAVFGTDNPTTPKFMVTVK